MTIGDIALWEKTGGRSGTYRRDPEASMLDEAIDSVLLDHALDPALQHLGPARLQQGPGCREVQFRQGQGEPRCGQQRQDTDPGDARQRGRVVQVQPQDTVLRQRWRVGDDRHPGEPDRPHRGEYGETEGPGHQREQVVGDLAPGVAEPDPDRL